MSGSCQCFLKAVNTFSVWATVASVVVLGFLISKVSEFFTGLDTHFALFWEMWKTVYKTPFFVYQ